MKIKNFFGHIHTVNTHRWLVFKLSIKAGIPLQGLVHDMSKYSPTEFFESIKYYTDGRKSPIIKCREENGYSKAWLHHKGRNKHHFEYWYDFTAKDKAIIMPFKYFCELICDNISASLAYSNKNVDDNAYLNYFLNRPDREYINKDLEKAIIEVYEDIAKSGIDKTISKKNLKRIYNKHIK